MGWALVGISADRGVGISWHNQFIGDPWGVRSGRLIRGNRFLSTTDWHYVSDSTVGTYRDAGAPADRRLLTRHGPRDKYRTPINSPPFFAPPGPTSREETGFRGDAPILLRPRDLPRSKPSRPMPEGSPSRRLPKRCGREIRPKLGRTRPPTHRSRPPGRGFIVWHPRAIRVVSCRFLTDSRPFQPPVWPKRREKQGPGSRRPIHD
jgi:hypothetical protein